MTWADCPYIEFVLKQGTTKWKQWRTGGFGASDMPVLMRKIPWKSVDGLLKEKRGYDDGYGNVAMREAHDLEPEARREYCKAVRFKVRSRCLQRFDYSWVRASLSRISSDRKILLKLNVGREHIKKPKMARSHGTIKGEDCSTMKLTKDDLNGIWAGVPISWNEDYALDEPALRDNL